MANVLEESDIKRGRPMQPRKFIYTPIPESAMLDRFYQDFLSSSPRHKNWVRRCARHPEIPACAKYLAEHPDIAELIKAHPEIGE